MIRRKENRCRAGIKHRCPLWRLRESGDRVLQWFYWNIKATLYYEKFHSSTQNKVRFPLLNCFTSFGQIKGF